MVYRVNESKQQEDYDLHMFETITGTLLVGREAEFEEYSSEDVEAGLILLRNPIKGTPGVNRTGQVGFSWAPWIGELVAINPTLMQGHLRGPIPENIRNTYTQITTGICVVSPGDLPPKGRLVS